MSFRSKAVFKSLLFAAVLALSLAGFSGCSLAEPDGSAAQNNSRDASGISAAESNDAESVYSSDAVKQSFTDYIALLGLTREELVRALNEEPVSIDEGGLEFERAGIRVWFDPDSFTKVEQIFTNRKDIDFNGAKIGDPISRFKEVFGAPVSDENGDAHFKYNDIFLSVNYDTATETTVAAYILKTDF